MGYVTPLCTSDGRTLIVQASPEGVSEEELEPAMGKGGPEIKDKEPGSTVVIFRSPPEPPKEENREATPAGFAQQFLCDIAVIDLASGEPDSGRHVHPAAIRRRTAAGSRAWTPGRWGRQFHRSQPRHRRARPVTGTSRDIVTSVLSGLRCRQAGRRTGGGWRTAATPRRRPQIVSRT
jgi:hypothetical protein